MCSEWNVGVYIKSSLWWSSGRRGYKTIICVFRLKRTRFFAFNVGREWSGAEWHDVEALFYSFFSVFIFRLTFWLLMSREILIFYNNFTAANHHHQPHHIFSKSIFGATLFLNLKKSRFEIIQFLWGKKLVFIKKMFIISLFFLPSSELIIKPKNRVSTGFYGSKLSSCACFTNQIFSWCF